MTSKAVRAVHDAFNCSECLLSGEGDDSTTLIDFLCSKFESGATVRDLTKEIERLIPS